MAYLSVIVLAVLLGYTVLNVGELGLDSLVSHMVVTSVPVTFEAYRYSIILWTLAGIALAPRYTWAILPFLVASFGVSELAFTAYWPLCGISLLSFHPAVYEYMELLYPTVIVSFLILRLHSRIRASYLTFVFPAYVGLWIILGTPIMQPHCATTESLQAYNWTNFGYELFWQIAVLVSCVSTFRPKRQRLSLTVS